MGTRHAGASTKSDNAPECQDYDDVGVLADLIAEYEQNAARLGYVLVSEMREDGSFSTAWASNINKLRQR